MHGDLSLSLKDVTEANAAFPISRFLLVLFLLLKLIFNTSTSWLPKHQSSKPCQVKLKTLTTNKDPL